MTDIEKFSELLRDDLYDSKDWRSADVYGRIEWLITGLENKNEEIKMWVEMVIDQQDKQK